MSQNTLPVATSNPTNLPSTKPINIAEARQNFNEVRQNLKDIIADSLQSIAEVKGLADQSQAARYYEALNGLLKTAIDANDKLMDQHEKIAKIEGQREQSNKSPTALILTSADMLRMLEEEEGKEDD